MNTLVAISPIVMLTATPWRPNHAGATVMNTQAYTEKNSTWKIELKATRPAQYSVSPRASSFHTITIAMQRARPIMISPTMYSGLSRRKMTASANIRIGPTTQFWTSESARTLPFRNTCPISS